MKTMSTEAKKLYFTYHPNSWESDAVPEYWEHVNQFLRSFHKELLPENGVDRVDLYSSNAEKYTLFESIPTTVKENQVSTNVTSENSYTFISERDAVDYVRIVKEAPAGTPFIVIEIKDRVTGKPRSGSDPEILILIHNNVVKNPRAKDLKVLEYKISQSEYWKSDPVHVPHLYSYVGRWVYSDQVNTFRNEISKVKKALSSKDTVTKVELL